MAARTHPHADDPEVVGAIQEAECGDRQDWQADQWKLTVAERNGEWFRADTKRRLLISHGMNG